jgi:hypothetical protein
MIIVPEIGQVATNTLPQGNAMPNDDHTLEPILQRQDHVFIVSAERMTGIAGTMLGKLGTPYNYPQSTQKWLGCFVP